MYAQIISLRYKHARDQSRHNIKLGVTMNVIAYTSLRNGNPLKQTLSLAQDERIITLWRRIVVGVLLTLVGFQLRSVILAVPPVLPLIQHDLGLSYSETGLLTSLPTLVLACFAWPVGVLAERVGPRLCVSLGLILLALGTLLRAVWVSAIALFLFTFLLSLGIVLAQTAVPVLIRRWFPNAIGSVAALFSDGLIIGEAVAAGSTLPLMEQFWGKDGWVATFIFWGLPVFVLLALWLIIAPRASALNVSSPVPEALNAELMHKDKLLSPQRTGVSALHLGILVGAGSLIYFGMNAWIASYNQALHHSSLTPLVLTILNSAQLPVSLAITVIAQQVAGRRLPFIVAGVICVCSIMGWIFTPVTLEPLWATLLGGSSAMVFTLGIALPPLLAAPHEVGRLTGITISLTYAVAFLGPFVGGALWDIFQIPAISFTPVIVASLALILLGSLLPSRDAFGLPH